MNQKAQSTPARFHLMLIHSSTAQTSRLSTFRIVPLKPRGWFRKIVQLKYFSPFPNILSVLFNYWDVGVESAPAGVVVVATVFPFLLLYRRIPFCRRFNAGVAFPLDVSFVHSWFRFGSIYLPRIGAFDRRDGVGIVNLIPCFRRLNKWDSVGCTFLKRTPFSSRKVCFSHYKIRVCKQLNVFIR